MNTFVWLFLGLLLGLIFVANTRKQNRDEKSLLAKGLVAAALLYVLFAIFGQAGGAWLLLELAGVIVFTSFGTLVCIWLVMAIWSLLAGIPLFASRLTQ